MQRRSFIKTVLAALGLSSIGLPVGAKQTVFREAGLRQEDLLDKRFTSSSPIYATKGEWVICERGHKIVQFSRDVNCGERFDPSALKDWQQLAPKYGEMIRPCTCGSHFFVGTQFHFENGWRV